MLSIGCPILLEAQEMRPAQAGPLMRHLEIQRFPRRTTQCIASTLTCLMAWVRLSFLKPISWNPDPKKRTLYLSVSSFYSSYPSPRFPSVLPQTCLPYARTSHLLFLLCKLSYIGNWLYYCAIWLVSTRHLENIFKVTISKFLPCFNLHCQICYK
jgi:hypothetical protein